ncbi:MAG: hypothetical protein OQL28_02770 [Sedimenticola sp.]|nr:hypothetical protein [Sedimenticola sp.]
MSSFSKRCWPVASSKSVGEEINMASLRYHVLVTVLLSIMAPGLATAQSDVIYDTTMATPVDSVPLKPTRFTLYDRRTITRIQTFHWNQGKGAKPGSIALQGKDKKLFGPWVAKGKTNEKGLVNAYWEVTPNQPLEAGTYTVLDSEPGTWSRNPTKGNVGIVRIVGQQGAVVPENVQPPAVDSATEADPTLTLEQQQVRAEQLFEQIRQADRYDYEQIEALYLQLIDECPDTEQAEESYFRLSNLYRIGMDPPEYFKLRRLLEDYLSRYVDTELAEKMRQRLLRLYEDTGQWQGAVELRDSTIADLSLENSHYLVIMLDYARALEGAGERDRALSIYRQVEKTAGGEQAADYDMSDLWLRVARNRIQMIGLIQAQKWDEVARLYREQFSKMAFVEMPQIQELLEYADALERIGDRSSAIAQYRQVMRTDQGHQTLQGQQASARLIELVGVDWHE